MKPIVMATVGDDFEPYRRRFDALGLSLRARAPGRGWARPRYLSPPDLDDNQITAVSIPGAMTQSHLNWIDVAQTGARLGIVAPDGRDGMPAHARQFVEAGILFVFDPGQGLLMFFAMS